MTIPSEPAALATIADRIDGVAADLRDITASGIAPSARNWSTSPPLPPR
jgi:hypothetical protein